MLKNYFTVALRNLLRYRGYSILNLTGLGVGLAASILILLWVKDEISFDRFHSSARQLYRITVNISGVKVALTPQPLAEALKTEVPQIADVTQIGYTTRLFTAGERTFEEKKVYFADSSFLEMFDFPLVKGDPRTALSQPDGLLLTEETANKYFGKEEPVGKIIQMDNEHSFIVRGVLKDIPANSHLQFDILLPMAFLTRTTEYQNTNGWDSYTSIYTYVQLRSDVLDSPAAIKEISNHINGIYTRQKMEMKAEFILQPLLDIHLKSGNLLVDVAGQGDMQYVRIFSLVALFILVVASINFMNLATARAVRRAKEVGMRKVLGAYSRQLIGQFLGESLIISMLSFLIALLLVLFALPAFNSLTGKYLELAFETDLVAGLLAIVVLTGLLAGSYPALYLSAFQPIQSLKGTFKAGAKSIGFRNGLVVVQFVVTIVLVVATSVVYRQLQFIRHQNLGFDRENILYVPMKRDMFPKYQSLRSALEASSVLKNFTVTSELPTNMSSATYDVEWEGKNVNEQTIFPLMSIDEYFIDVMDMKLLTGRSFSKGFTADTSNYVINEKASKVMGLDPLVAIGKSFSVNGKRGTIIGVVQDFHFKPLQQMIEPLIMQLNTFGGFVMVRTRPSDTQATVHELELVFGKHAPAYSFEYGFLDQNFEALYNTENRISVISGVFAGLAIFIACLGLFGLSAFMAEQRIKEIGVRKVVGATASNIFLLLSKGFVQPILIAMALATPLAWYLMNQWLENYAYHVPVNAWTFILAGIIALLLALLTTSFQTIKAALANPVKSLRNE
jgi:ABC-type antimicrobial peptide transport system permease subunit